MYNAKMKISPKVLENRDIRFHAFTNSTKYMRYIQISKFIIGAATHGSFVSMRLFNREKGVLRHFQAPYGVGLTTIGNTGSLINIEYRDSPMEVQGKSGTKQAQIQTHNTNQVENLSSRYYSLNTVVRWATKTLLR